jgi:hypothetical protein
MQFSFFILFNCYSRSPAYGQNQAGSFVPFQDISISERVDQ